MAGQKEINEAEFEDVDEIEIVGDLDDDIQDEDETELDEVEAEGEPEAEAEERDWEAEAKAQGWRADGGDKTAEQFVRDGEKYASVQSRRAEQAAKDFEDRLARMERMSQERERRGLEKQRREIEARFERQAREAVSLADETAYDTAKQQREKDLQELEPAKTEQPQFEVKPEFQSWIDTNTWFDSPEHAGATAFAVAELNRLAALSPNVSRHALLPQVDAKMAEVFPDLVGAKPRQKPRQMTDTGGSRRSGKRAKGVADLPAEAKRAAKDDIEDGLFKNMEEYAAAYWSQ